MCLCKVRKPVSTNAPANGSASLPLRDSATSEFVLIIQPEPAQTKSSVLPLRLRSRSASLISKRSCGMENATWDGRLCSKTSGSSTNLIAELLRFRLSTLFEEPRLHAEHWMTLKLGYGPVLIM